MKKGDTILKGGISENEYTRIHNWLRKHYGKANCCENPECVGKSKYFQWSKIKGKPYEKTREHFRMLCISCHTKYDYTEYKLQALRDRVYTEEQIKKIADKQRGKKASEETRQKLSKIFSGSGNPMYGVSISGENHSWWGKNHSEESKIKMLESSAKVTKEQVEEIRKEKESGVKQRDIAKKYGISTASVCRIVNNKRYKLWA